MNKNLKNLIIVILLVALAISLYFNFVKSSVPANEAASEQKLYDIEKCQQYREEIIADVEGLGTSEDVSWKLDEIWFSHSVNSCVYSAIKINPDLEWSNEYRIHDYLENDIIFFALEAKNKEAMSDFVKKKIELK
jgi:hypothetical protein